MTEPAGRQVGSASPQHDQPRHCPGAPHQKAIATPAEIHDLRCHVQRSIRYHRAREGFFQSIADVSSFLMLMLGSGAAANLLTGWPQQISIALAALVALVQAFELVFQVTAKARLHSALASDFLGIERAIERSDALTSKDIRDLRAEILTIEAREPPIKRYLDLICHNQVARSLGSDDLEDLTFWQRHLAHFRSGASALQTKRS